MIAEKRKILLAAINQPLRDRIFYRSLWVGGLLLLIYSAWISELIGPKFFAGLPKLGHALSLMLVPSGFEHIPEFLWALGETLAMAFLGTLIAAVLAIPLAFLCSKTTLPIRFAQWGFRRFSDSLRSLDYLIWALVFVRAIGLGPVAGILAIAAVDLGTLAKLYSEAIDNVSQKPIEGVRSSGGSWLDMLNLGVLPQVTPNMLSAALYIFESNVRSASILGIVGAGGIGYQLADRLRVYEFGQASLIVIMIIITVAVIDGISGRLRALLIGRKS